jgi:hypothetical protein
MRDFIKIDFQKGELRKINNELEGEQQDCPKGDKTRIQIDAPDSADTLDAPDDSDNDKKEDENKLNEEETAKIELLINKTYEMCKSFLFPLLALISRSYKLFDFKDIFTSQKTKKLIISLLKDKKIELDNDNYIIVNIMNNIIDNNAEIVNNIREIYSIAPAIKLRDLIEKHFIPTNDEKKRNAEVPTPVKLVDEMLNTIPIEFWKTPKKVFEPCCGKGNFVLGIFDRFYKGLEEMYPDEMERCSVIMTECIYYADLTSLNVFITTEIIKCHVQSYCGLDELDFEFNNYTGDSLELNIKDKWNVNGFDMICGNPPYDVPVGPRKTQPIWNLFVKKFIDNLNENGYLLFVNPSGWRSPDGIFRDVYDKIMSKNLIYINMNDFKKGSEVFGVGTNFDYYLLQNNNLKSIVKIIDIYNKEYNINLHNWSFIPSGCFEVYIKVLAFDGEERVQILHDYSSYETRKKWMSKEKTSEYKYPCCYTITTKDGINLLYSSEKKGHFDIPKVIWSNGLGTYPVIDENGDYGLTQFSYAIIDNKNNLKHIKNALDNKSFIKLMEYVKFTNNKYNYKVIALFKKDFWKQFIENPESKKKTLIIEEDDDDEFIN